MIATLLANGSNPANRFTVERQSQQSYAASRNRRAAAFVAALESLLLDRFDLGNRAVVRERGPRRTNGSSSCWFSLPFYWFSSSF